MASPIVLIPKNKSTYLRDTTLAATLQVADLAANTNWNVSAGPFGIHSGLQFSGDGQSLAYATSAANVAGDANAASDVYLFSFQSRSNSLVSTSSNLINAANGPSDSPALSADGRFVVYRSLASDIAAGASNSTANLYVLDRQTGTNSLLTRSRFGGAADSRSRTPVFSGDGRTVVFQSWADDLASRDYNSTGDMFAFTFFYLYLTPADSPPGTLALNWPAVPGQTYQVQYKNNLTDSLWQNLAGSVGIMGNQAYLTNAAPAPGRQFYRVFAH